MAESKIWMEVTQDDYQLPLAVAESAAQLAIMVNTTSVAIRSSASRYDRGLTKYPTYISVDKPEDW